MRARDVVVIGGPLGGAAHLGAVLKAVPSSAAAALALSAPGTGAASAPFARSAAPRWAVDEAENGARLKAGRIVAARADAHLLLDEGGVRLGSGPRENGLRPAADALFRSAALAFGPRVLAVLVGTGPDGQAGLDAVRGCGGGALCWPGDAAALPELLAGAGAEAVEDPSPLLDLLRWEAAAAMGGKPLDPAALRRLGTPAARTCPACARPLFRLPGTAGRMRCEGGHGFSAEALGVTVEDAERQRRALATEFQHRVRNMLALIRSMAARTAENSRGVEDFAMHLDGRLDAIARVQVLTGPGTTAGTNLEHLVAEELVAHLAHEGARVTIEGPRVNLRFKAAQAFALAVHELATDALNVGALSQPKGKVAVRWRIEEAGPRLVFEWTETSRAAARPEGDGFGVALLRRLLAYELGADVSVDGSSGLFSCRIDLPLEKNVVTGSP